jgi:hypothetical protein
MPTVRWAGLVLPFQVDQFDGCFGVAHALQTTSDPPKVRPKPWL